ncbi:MAG TPA: hypothetical protein VJC00_04470 [Candidatus Nanoarchaeia archaeon]|nr:hypothetical protein [Candidatus Nanoarchaeia archaeon]
MDILERFQAAPLSSSFFFVSIVGILISLFYWDSIWSPSWSFTFLILFGAMFVASLISMKKAPIDAEIAVDHHARKSRRKQ